MALVVTWFGALLNVAQRLNQRAAQDNRWGEREALSVHARRRRSVSSWTVTEGLYFGNLWTDGFEVARVRRLFSRRWDDRQSVQDAASKVGSFVRVRPDLTGEDA